MGGVAKKQSAPVTDSSPRSKKAHKVEKKIVAGCSAIRQVWVALAAYFHEFHTEEMWEDLGYESFEEWLGSPDISLSRSHVYALIQTHNDLVLGLGVDPKELEGLEASKIVQVLPALKRGDVEIDVALADVEALSRADLREKYNKVLPAGRVPLIECEKCGAMRKPHKGSGSE